MTQPDLLSVVIPVFNNGPTLRSLTERCKRAAGTAGCGCALIFVDDASSDGSRAVLRDIQRQDPSVSVVENSFNQGQQRAIHAGLRQARGAFVAVMDADLQDRPEALPDLIAVLKARNLDAIFAARSNSYQSVPRMVTSVIFRRVLRAITNLPRGAGGYVVMRAHVARRLAAHDKRRFYLAGLIGCQNYRLSAIDVARDRRVSGNSSYSMSGRLKQALSNYFVVIQERTYNARKQPSDHST